MRKTILTAEQPKPEQTKKHALLETAQSVSLGAVLGLVSQLVVFPLVGIDVPFTTNLKVIGYFILIDFTRIYLVRRWHKRDFS